MIASTITVVLAFISSWSPLALVVLISIVIGFAMVIAFRYTSDQKAIARAKDQLKAQMLAVRLFQDQLRVVLRSYARILSGTGRYLRLALKPLLIAIVPLTLIVIQLDHYLSWRPFSPEQSFVVEAQVENPDVLNDITLQLPSGLTATSPAVHIPRERRIAWRVVAAREGKYHITIDAAGKSASKEVLVSAEIARVSPIRLRGRFWERMLHSTESELPNDSPVQAIAVTYSPRMINFAGTEWDWIVLFFLLSLVAGFIFKTAFGIQI
jgi:uncharacterized membrane protein (DUF106 family)